MVERRSGDEGDDDRAVTMVVTEVWWQQVGDGKVIAMMQWLELVTAVSGLLMVEAT